MHAWGCLVASVVESDVAFLLIDSLLFSHWDPGTAGLSGSRLNEPFASNKRNMRVALITNLNMQGVSLSHICRPPLLY